MESRRKMLFDKSLSIAYTTFIIEHLSKRQGQPLMTTLQSSDSYQNEQIANTTLTAGGDVNPALLASLEWRSIGPYRGGRVVAVAGDPANPLVFYFGSTGGGVWKTTDGGDTWSEITRYPGLPQGLLGKIGIAVSPAKEGRLWTIVEAADGAVFRSD